MIGIERPVLIPIITYEMGLNVSITDACGKVIEVPILTFISDILDNPVPSPIAE